MTVVLGAANAYLGLRAGTDHRRDLPRRGDRHGSFADRERSILEETSPGRRVPSANPWRRARVHAAGFRDRQGLAFLRIGDAYWKSIALMLVGSVLGVLFVSL